MCAVNTEVGLCISVHSEHFVSVRSEHRGRPCITGVHSEHFVCAVNTEVELCINVHSEHFEVGLCINARSEIIVLMCTVNTLR